VDHIGISMKFKSFHSSYIIFVIGYRRGLPDCGDIDILITLKSARPSFATFLQRLKASLYEKRLLVAGWHVAFTTCMSRYRHINVYMTDLTIGKKRYNGVCQYKQGLARLLDIK
jgi:hypothetical protein